MDDRPPIILSVVQAGTPEYPRFKVMDSYQRYWTGSAWVADERKGLTYASSNDACIDVQRLLTAPYMDKPVRRFRAPVYLDLFCDRAIPKHELVRWLVRCSKLLLDHSNCGIGPVSGSLGNLTIEWGELEQVTEQEGRPCQ